MTCAYAPSGNYVACGKYCRADLIAGLVYIKWHLGVSKEKLKEFSLESLEVITMQLLPLISTHNPSGNDSAQTY